MKYKHTITQNIRIGSVNIENTPKGLYLTLNSGVNGAWLSEDMDYIGSFAYRLPDLMKVKPKKVLVAGLGLGLISCYLEKEYPDSEVTAVEIRQDVVDAMKLVDKLKTSTIINQSIWDYKPNETYDLVIMDIWFNCNDKMPPCSEIEQRIEHLVSPGGKVYVPLRDRVY